MVTVRARRVTTVKTSLQNEDPPLRWRRHRSRGACDSENLGVIVTGWTRLSARTGEVQGAGTNPPSPAFGNEAAEDWTKRRSNRSCWRMVPHPFLPSATDTSERLKRRRVGRIAGRLSVHGSAPLNFSSGPPFMARGDGGIAVALASVYHTCALYSSLPHNRPRPAALGCTVHT
ncbi:hypothetical protein MRX96_015696 [Rhipicephalus microplus]